MFLGFAQGFPIGFGSLNQSVVIGEDFFQNIHPADKIIEVFGAEQYIEVVDLTVFINIADPAMQCLGLNLELLGQPIGKLDIGLDMLLGVLQLVVDGFILIFRRVQFLLDRPQLLGDRLLLAPGQLSLALLRFDLLLHTVQLLLLFFQFIRQHRRCRQYSEHQHQHAGQKAISFTVSLHSAPPSSNFEELLHRNHAAQRADGNASAQQEYVHITHERILGQ